MLPNIRYGLAQRLAAALAPVVVVCALGACAGPYRHALREMALPHSDRLAIRVNELIECATHAANSLERVAQWYRTHDAPADAPGPASLRVARAEAEASAFDAARRALSVRDVIAEMDPDESHPNHPILDAANTVVEALDRAVTTMNAGNLTDPARLGALQASTDEASRAIAALRERARDMGAH